MCFLKGTVKLCHPARKVPDQKTLIVVVLDETTYFVVWRTVIKEKSKIFRAAPMFLSRLKSSRLADDSPMTGVFIQSGANIRVQKNCLYIDVELSLKNCLFQENAR